jgi:hypothetical protein
VTLRICPEKTSSGLIFPQHRETGLTRDNAIAVKTKTINGDRDTKQHS